VILRVTLTTFIHLERGLTPEAEQVSITGVPSVSGQEIWICLRDIMEDIIDDI